MEKPGKKLKKFFIITGITGMVYAGLKYLLPLVVPLLLGYTLALLLRPSARFLQHRITVRIFGKKWKPSLGLIGSVQLLILAVLGSFLLTLGIRRLWEETVYFDEPASCMAGWALFLDRGKMFRS